MKRVLITASALFISVSYAGAQTTKAKLGVRAGVNLSNVIKSGDSDFSTGSKMGFNAAVFADLPLAAVFSIQPEVQFSQKGFKSTGTFLGAPYEYKQTTNFIEVPVLAKIKPVPSFAILAGPQFSFLTSTTTKFNVNNTSYEDKVKTENDNLRKNILGGVLGLEATASNFVVGLRYNMDFQQNNGDGTSTTLKYKNQVTSLYVGFTF